MKSYLIDYYLKEGKNEFWETIEISAENYEDAEHKLHEQICGDVEIRSVFSEEN